MTVQNKPLNQKSLRDSLNKQKDYRNKTNKKSSVPKVSSSSNGNSNLKIKGTYIAPRGAKSDSKTKSKKQNSNSPQNNPIPKKPRQRIQKYEIEIQGSKFKVHSKQGEQNLRIYGMSSDYNLKTARKIEKSFSYGAMMSKAEIAQKNLLKAIEQKYTFFDGNNEVYEDYRDILEREISKMSYTQIHNFFEDNKDYVRAIFNYDDRKTTIGAGKNVINDDGEDEFIPYNQSDLDEILSTLEKINEARGSPKDWFAEAGVKRPTSREIKMSRTFKR